jgi:Flp pilus assembly protein TadD
LFAAAGILAAQGEEALRTGLLALQRGDLAAAQASLEAASRQTPRDGRVWAALSQTYWRLHRNAEADAAAAKAAETGGRDPGVQQALAIYYSETNRPLQAARALVSGPRAAEFYFAAAKPLLEAQKFGEALAILQEATGRVSDDAQLRLALGVACYGLRRFDEAADAFLKTIDLAPDVEQPYVFLGKILDQIPARLPQVTARFAAYEAAHPESAAGYLLHAKAIDAQAGDAAQALALTEKSLALSAGDASAWFEKGVALDRQERYGEAAAAFEKSAGLTPGEAAVHYRLARDYDRLGRSEDAARERKRHAELIQGQERRR